MANISDVHDIQFECNTEEMAIALENYLKAIEATDPYYATTQGVTRLGLTMTGGEVMGRWVYSNNLEGTFERPEEWFDGTLPKAEWEAVKALLMAGETIDVGYSEDEPGCEVYQDGYGQISWDSENKKVVLGLDFSEHDKPACEIDLVDGKPYCFDHDEPASDLNATYCEVGEM